MRAGEDAYRRLDSGERSLAGRARNAVIQAALARYAFAAPLCSGRRVLDMGCGDGFGTKLLAAAARATAAIDYSGETLASFRDAFLENNIRAAAADARAVPFRSGSFEAVTAFEIIEHLSDPATMLAEVQRVLAPGGIFILSTPNRPVYSPGGTWLDYHAKEYDAGELRGLLVRRFEKVTLYGQDYLSKDALLDTHPLNRFFYPLKRRLDPRGRVLNRIRAAYVYLRWGEKSSDCSIADFPVVSMRIETRPVLLAVCGKSGRSASHWSDLSGGKSSARRAA